MQQEHTQPSTFIPPTAIPTAIDTQYKQFIDLVAPELREKLLDLRFLNDKQKVQMLTVLLADCGVNVDSSVLAFLLHEYGDTEKSLEVAGVCHMVHQNNLTMRCIFARIAIEQGELALAQKALASFDLTEFNQNNEPYKLVDVIEFYNACALFFFCLEQCKTALSYVNLLIQVAGKSHPYTHRMNLITYRCACTDCKEYVKTVIADMKNMPTQTAE